MTTPGGKPPQSIRHVSLVIYHWSFQVRVRPRQRVQDALVVAVVRPVVGFSKADVERARLVLLQMRKGKAVGIRIVADAVPGRIRLKLQLAQLSDYPVRMVIGLKACVGSDGSGLVLHDPVYSVPGRKRGDPL